MLNEVSDDELSGMDEVAHKCHEIMTAYRGKSIKELCNIFGLGPSTVAKQTADKLIARMFGGREAKKVSDIEQLAKLGLIGQIVVLNKNGGRTEDMKLSACILDFDELNDPDITFEDTEAYEFFNDYRLLCPIFKEHPQNDGKVVYGDNTFEGFKLFNLNSDDVLDTARTVWTKAKDLIQNDELTVSAMYTRDGKLRITPKTGVVMTKTNLPKSKDYNVFFRGTSTDATRKENINGLEMYRQNYWIKGKYIVDELNNQDYIGITPFIEEHPDVSYDNSELSQYGMVAADGDGSDTVKMR